jgi:mRNA interferase HigB
MHIITKRRLLEFSARFPKSYDPLMAWHRTVRKGYFANFAELKASFGSVDYVKGKYVFDIGGNKYRLITAIHFDQQRVFVRHVMTHAEYEKGAWK